MEASASPSISPSLLTPTTTTTTTATSIATPPSHTPHTSHQPPTSTTTATPSTPSPTFQFPPHHSFPPFYTLQPNLTTLARQLTLWATLTSTYCATHSLFRLSLSTAPTLPLFNNPSIHRSLDALSIRRILDFMTTAEGSHAAEWLSPSSSASSRKKTALLSSEDKTTALIWWHTPASWGEKIYAWVDETGQRGSVLTVYELRESDAVAGQEWVGMDEDVFMRCLEALVKRGKAQVFESQGGSDGAGVKFF